MWKISRASSPENETRRVGNLDLSSLAPSFDESRHGGYYRLLVRAIKDKRHRNVALTGAYGAGKSSILQQLVTNKPRKTVVLSLSTITPDAYDAGEPTGEDGHKGPRTREIQKEIVKQLLYRLKPSSVPQSRFRRPDLPRRISAAVVSFCAAIVLCVLTVLLAFEPIQDRVEQWFPELWRQRIAYVVAFAVLCFLMWIVVKLVRARPKFTASVQSGGATVTLAKGEDSYFDAYLDEIVYFFQASRVDTVIIEDIDRFEDILVFDTLRALNGILNGSQQVGRRVVFVYAIRDSVFEQIATGSSPGSEGPSTSTAGQNEDSSDHALDGLKRASRTKFFDIIIPVVPFVSADNARDLMSDVMSSTEFTISPALIRLAARHVADMRLIHNIRNEFEIYRERLVVPDSRVPGINDDLVFAIVLYKNTHLADFENIRYRESRLDHLFMFWRHLVNKELETRTRNIAATRRRQRLESSAAARAERLGTRLCQFRDSLQAATSSTVQLSGPATDETLMEPSTWDAIAEGECQQFTVVGGHRNQITLSFSSTELGQYLGIPIEGDGWAPSEVIGRQQKLDADVERVKFLRHHSWAEISTRNDLKADLHDLAKPLLRGVIVDEPVTFSGAIELLLESDLARDLVRHGYLTSHFATYSASYYGTHLGPAAREYIWRCIEPGDPDGMFEIDATQVEQLLREQGADKKDQGDDADIFEDASLFNVSILDYLIKERPTAATKIARRLATMGNQEREFLDLYVAHGVSPYALISHITPHWRKILTYIANADITNAQARLMLLDAALKVLPDSKYETDDQVRTLIEDSYRELPAVSKPRSAKAAESIAALLQACGGQISSLSGLHETARNAFVKFSLYPITSENLKVVVLGSDVGLDTIQPNSVAYDYVLSHLDQYLALVTGAEVSLLVDLKQFSQIIDTAAKYATAAQLRQLIAFTPKACQVQVLSAVDPTAWPPIVGLGRTSATFANVDVYLTEHGMDTDLGQFLRQVKSIKDLADASLERRQEVAVGIVNAQEEIDSAHIRVRLARSIKPGKLDPDELTPERGKLISYLLKARLLEDGEATFARRLMIDWDTLKPTILASKQFSSFVSPTFMSIGDFTRVVRDSEISNDIVKAMFADLNSYLNGVSASQAYLLASALVDHRWRLSASHIDMLLDAGAGADMVMQLLRNAGERRTVDEVKALLRRLGGKYAKVADGGSGRPSFRNDDAHRYVFERLVGDSVRGLKVASFKLWDGNALVVNLK